MYGPRRLKGRKKWKARRWKGPLGLSQKEVTFSPRGRKKIALEAGFRLTVRKGGGSKRSWSSGFEGGTVFPAVKEGGNEITEAKKTIGQTRHPISRS